MYAVYRCIAPGDGGEQLKPTKIYRLPRRESDDRQSMAARQKETGVRQHSAPLRKISDRAESFIRLGKVTFPPFSCEVNPKSWTKIKLNLLMTSSVFYRTCFQFRYNSFIVVIFYIFF